MRPLADNWRGSRRGKTGSKTGSPLPRLERLDWRASARLARPAFIALAILLVAGVVVNHRAFASGSNFDAVLLFWPVVALATLGESLALVSGGIDLSIGGIVSLAGAVTMTLNSSGTPGSLAVLAGLGVGVAAGLANGLLIGLVRVPPLVGTLATLYLFNGFALYLTRGNTAYGAPTILTHLANASILPDVPANVSVGLVAAFMIGGWLYRTRPGTRVRVFGNSRRAGRFLGIGRLRSMLWVYGMCGLLFAAAAMVQMGELDSYYAVGASDLLLPAVAAAVLGGAALDGGAVGLVGGAVGAIVLSLIQNVFDIAGLSQAAHELGFGVVVALAIGIERGIAIGAFTRLKARLDKKARSWVLQQRHKDLASTGETP